MSIPTVPGQLHYASVVCRPKHTLTCIASAHCTSVLQPSPTFIPILEGRSSLREISQQLGLNTEFQQWREFVLRAWVYKESSSNVSLREETRVFPHSPPPPPPEAALASEARHGFFPFLSLSLSLSLSLFLSPCLSILCFLMLSAQRPSDPDVGFLRRAPADGACLRDARARKGMLEARKLHGQMLQMI